MILLTNGCSHSVPYKTIQGTEWCHQINLKLKIKNYFWMGKHEDFFFNSRQIYFDSLDKLPSKDFTYSLASSGKGNDAIYFETIETIERLKKRKSKPDLVLIQWSGPSRRLTVNPLRDEIFCVTPDDIIEGVAIPHFEPLASELTFRFSELLAQYLEKENIEYRFLFYFDLDNRIFKYRTNIDDKKLIGFPKGLISTMKEKELTWDKPGHPHKQGHIFLSNLFLSKLPEKFKKVQKEKLI